MDSISGYDSSVQWMAGGRRREGDEQRASEEQSRVECELHDCISSLALLSKGPTCFIKNALDANGVG